MGFVVGMQIHMLVPIPNADRMPIIVVKEDDFAEQMKSDLCMLREQLEEAQTWLILEANKSRCPHDFKGVDSVILTTRLFKLGYANLTKSESASVNSRIFHHHFGRLFCITEAISANAFRLNTPAH
jgi:hypothetical protein